MAYQVVVIGMLALGQVVTAGAFAAEENTGLSPTQAATPAEQAEEQAETHAVGVFARPANVPGYTIHQVQPPAGIELEVTGLGIDANDRIYMCTRLGELWRYAPDTESEWALLAQGFMEPTGLHVSPDGSTILIAQKPELTELMDVDGDGVYERQRVRVSGFGFSGNYHEFHFGPVFDSLGRIYGSLNLSHSKRAGRWVGNSEVTTLQQLIEHRGWAYRSDRPGHFTLFASGLRSPSGITISPSDELFITDNQGDWVPTSALYHVQQGNHYLHPSSLFDHPWLGDREPQSVPLEELVALQTQPAIWFPHGELANAPGTPVWDTTGGAFGPFAGQIFIGEQTQSRVIRAGLERIDGAYQGWCTKFIDGMRSGALRGAFDSQGRLWVGQTGRGWKAVGGEPWALEYITFDGHAVDALGVDGVAVDGPAVPFAVHSMALQPDGFALQFTSPISPDTPAPTVTFWSYKRHPNYGSPKVDETTVPAELMIAQDGLSAKLQLAELQVGTVYQISFAETTASMQGTTLSNPIMYYTLNRLPRANDDETSIEPAAEAESSRPQLPGSGWLVHDQRRPQPIAVTPAPFITTEMPDAAIELTEWDNSSWEWVDGVLTVGRGDARSQVDLGDGRYYFEFQVPRTTAPSRSGQQRGNSGIFFFDRYELQILDSFEQQTYPDGQCAALYGQEPPWVNACRSAGDWQSFDVLVKAARFNQEGECIAPTRITVYHNGVLVHDDMSFIGPTNHRSIKPYQAHELVAPVRLQDHGSPVQFRQLWHQPLDYDRALAPFRRGDFSGLE